MQALFFKADTGEKYILRPLVGDSEDDRAGFIFARAAFMRQLKRNYRDLNHDDLSYHYQYLIPHLLMKGETWLAQSQGVFLGFICGHKSPLENTLHLMYRKADFMPFDSIRDNLIERLYDPGIAHNFYTFKSSFNKPYINLTGAKYDPYRIAKALI